MNKKLIVLVEGVDKYGDKAIVKVPFTNDWQHNLTVLNKKISKKFQTKNEYGLSLNGMTTRFDDVQGLANIMNQVDFNDKPRFKIIDISNCTPDPDLYIENDIKMDDRQIIIHYSNYKDFIFNISAELNEVNDDIFDDLLDDISQHFKLKINDQQKYKIVDDENCDIDDVDDLNGALNDKQDEEAVHLYIKRKNNQAQKPHIDQDFKDDVKDDFFIVDDPEQIEDVNMNNYPVMPLVMPDNCSYNPQTKQMTVDHNKPRRTLVLHKPVMCFNLELVYLFL